MQNNRRIGKKNFIINRIRTEKIYLFSFKPLDVTYKEIYRQPIPECSQTQTEKIEIINIQVVKEHHSGRNRTIINVETIFRNPKQTPVQPEYFATFIVSENAKE